METTETKDKPYRVYKLTKVDSQCDQHISFVIEDLKYGYLRTKYAHNNWPEDHNDVFNGAVALLVIEYKYDAETKKRIILFGLFSVFRETEYSTGNEIITCEPLVDIDGKQIAFYDDELTETPFGDIWHTYKKDERGFPAEGSSSNDITLYNHPISPKYNRELKEKK